ncbi:MAG: hypothetical protein COV52_07745 [Gammaproteobacteria bacterium CG11_big_fil_rev_8_21_14_0_20_46_22]|nr:MAG: hypothetical protein COW05_03825 [Gammaproteobacteria bacterium CG12_big_fil_rev_8_21_14_0_65_46_12]PIR10650.1 MAG: hypothetical protein COV52_07745 [Gammaproteobacteria bacterium CG11_big_fil_rev_8_21_14_0_20_46_22]
MACSCFCSFFRKSRQVTDEKVISALQQLKIKFAELITICYENRRSQPLALGLKTFDTLIDISPDSSKEKLTQIKFIVEELELFEKLLTPESLHFAQLKNKQEKPSNAQLKKTIEKANSVISKVYKQLKGNHCHQNQPR